MRGITEFHLDDMSREELIEWLSWNDRNGSYRDEECAMEFGEILTYQEALWLAKSQING